jgi:hypothetical protein
MQSKINDSSKARKWKNIVNLLYWM